MIDTRVRCGNCCRPPSTNFIVTLRAQKTPDGCSRQASYPFASMRQFSWLSRSFSPKTPDSACQHDGTCDRINVP